jgi:hypothetical protein
MAGKQLNCIRDWDQWLKKWEDTKCAETLQGLLHVGFDVPRGSNESHTQAERILKYLSLADGFCEPRLMFEDGASSLARETSFGTVPVSEVRKRLARKAVAVLYKKVFALEYPPYTLNKYPMWLMHLVDERVLDKVIWFFRTEDEGKNIRNIVKEKDSRLGEGLERFATELCILMWEFPSLHGWESSAEDERIRKLFATRLVKIVPLMVKLRLTNLFIMHIRKVTPEILNAFQDMVMNEHYLFPGEEGCGPRKPRTVQEACISGVGMTGPAIAALHLNSVFTILEAFETLTQHHDLEDRDAELQNQREAEDLRVNQFVTSTTSVQGV